MLREIDFSDSIPHRVLPSTTSSSGESTSDPRGEVIVGFTEVIYQADE